jgi:hypothetical protein
LLYLKQQSRLRPANPRAARANAGFSEISERRTSRDQTAPMRKLLPLRKLNPLRAERRPDSHGRQP